MCIVHLIYILLLYVLYRTMVFLKVLLSTLLEEHKAAIQFFSLFKSNVVKIFSLNGTQRTWKNLLEVLSLTVILGELSIETPIRIIKIVYN